MEHYREQIEKCKQNSLKHFELLLDHHKLNGWKCSLFKSINGFEPTEENLKKACEEQYNRLCDDNYLQSEFEKATKFEISDGNKEFDQLFTDHIINGQSVISKDGNKIKMTNQWYNHILPRMYELSFKSCNFTAQTNLNNVEYHKWCGINLLFSISYYNIRKTFTVTKNKIRLENGDYISVSKY